MSAFKQKMAKLGARAGLLAGASAAVLAISGIGASSALAATPCVETNPRIDIQGKGASLQKNSQELWTGRKVPSNEILGIPHELTSGGYAAKCKGEKEATVSYTSTGSGSALTAFRFNGAGAIDTTFAYVGTDDAPNGTQIGNAEGAAKGAKPVIFPVAQTAISIPIHMPTGCAFESGKGITWTDLNKVFAGTLKKWNELETDNGNAACNVEFTRVVRKEGSGTTYQFKNYLAVLQAEKSGVGPGCGVTNWSELLAIGAEEKPNITWPTCAGTSPVVTQAGGGAVAKYVFENNNTIGYAALPDAVTNKATVALLQDGTGKSGATYGAPASESSANCGSRQYSVPAAAQKTGTNTGIAVDWSGVFGAKPNIGSPFYPLCTLTYDVGWTNASTVGYGANVGKVVSEYLSMYVVAAEGQALVSGNNYSALPSVPGTPANDVLGAAQLAAEHLG
jgi:ABC-type phosphate transport system substrate-binding protein